MKWRRSARPGWNACSCAWAQGSGSYRYLGDLNNNGIADESEFVTARFDGDFIAITVPTDQLFPWVTDLFFALFRLIQRQ